MSSTSSSFHFSPTPASPQHLPISPLDATAPAPAAVAALSTSPTVLLQTSADPRVDSALAAPPLAPLTSRPAPTVRALSFAAPNQPSALANEDAASAGRRVSYAGPGYGPPALDAHKDDIWGLAGGRTIRAESDGAVLGVIAREKDAREQETRTLTVEEETEEQAEEQRAAFRDHERRSLESIAGRLSSTNSFTQQTLLSPTSQSPPAASAAHITQLQAQAAQDAQLGADPGRASASLHLGDLDVWMDEAYVRECCARMGWEGVTNIKMIRGASPSSGYCFLTFPTAAHAAQVLSRFAAAPPVLMPRSARVFKLNWGTGLPGVQPRWDGEYSVFVGDLGREVGEAELVSLFTPIFPSTKSAKIMYDPSTGVSRGYGFVRFAEESDMQRALHLGQNAGSGLSLHGRTLRISEASGPGNALDANGRARTESDGLPPLMTSGVYGGYGQPEPSPNAYAEYRSPGYATPYAAPLSPASQQFGMNPALQPGYPRGPASPSMYGIQQLHQQPQQQSGGSQSHTTDPNNTTVFVGGLPACISEETLKSFFHHFGEITYCKIPTGKGCGFVQFVRRADAELAIAKMNDFPIHGKSRIRLSWGRSQGDKQVEHVRKLASALGVPFEAVWRMVQGQDNTTIKQITTAVGGTPVLGSRFDALGMGRMELGAVASAAGLTEAEVMELVGGRAGSSDQYASNGRNEAEYYRGNEQMNGYGRPAPNYGSFPTAAGSNGHLPISPPPSASYSQGYLQQQQQNGGYNPAAYAGANQFPYSPASPYDRPDYNDARNRGQLDRFAQQQAYQGYGQQRYPAQQYADPRQASYPSSQSSYSHEQAPSSTTTLEESFGQMGFGDAPARGFTGAAQDFFPASKGAEDERARGGYMNPIGDDRNGAGAQWA